MSETYDLGYSSRLNTTSELWADIVALTNAYNQSPDVVIAQCLAFRTSEFVAALAAGADLPRELRDG